MFKQALTLVTALSIIAASADQARAEVEASVGLIGGPLLSPGVGLEAGFSVPSVPFRLDVQLARDLTSDHFWASGWASATPLRAQEVLTMSPLIGLHTNITVPGVTRGVTTPPVTPRLLLGFSLQKSWGRIWGRLSPTVGWGPLDQQWFLVESLGGYPPPLEVGYRLTDVWEVSIRLTPYSPLKVSFTF